ncbi:MAG: phosphonopyruvate decarboxylase [Nanohaloarchaea archaeon]|nr:phosphonopyruvate decarboxylase [Candidatus Nanohaloarchaea archaeon]
MIDCEKFVEILHTYDIDFFAGVPDSLLKNFCAYLMDNIDPKRHIITANEGGAIGLAAGRYLSTQEIGLVYMQNSGEGNAINPLVSLADLQVYSIPILLLIGWRGEPGKHDEPQHVKQGQITLKLLDTMDIPYSILPDSIGSAEKCIKDAFEYMNKKKASYALVVKKGTFDKYELKTDLKDAYEMEREGAIKCIVDQLDLHDVVVSSTGKISRELFEYREELGQDHSRDFLTVGSMGHSSQIALGIALSKPERDVYCIEGDGSYIMHMGASTIVGSTAPKNLKHIVLNNGAHDSVGGQPTAGFDINIPAIAKACNYKLAMRAETEVELSEKLKKLKASEGPVLLEIMVKKGSRSDLGRPITTPAENRQAFMDFLKNNKR